MRNGIGWQCTRQDFQNSPGNDPASVFKERVSTQMLHATDLEHKVESVPLVAREV